ncbi:MAG: ribonuclease HI [Bacteroidia bacterium]|nr:ribonuclease HI [Bacteroidia bacterium]MCO5254713.1 ribonuclease HI [Bacteroidota bacterium]MCZ2130292.1 ribonuclease HI [Bacteroidia bacterium]
MDKTHKTKLSIYTDGSARGNPGPGGYGAILIYGDAKLEISDGFRNTTNNRMELMAVIEAIKKIKRINMEIDIYTDSKYVCDSINKGWLQSWVKKNFKDKKNVDLWKEFLEVSKMQNIHFHWVKGHNGHPLNERCDELATQAADNKPKKTDIGYESENP